MILNGNQSFDRFMKAAVFAASTAYEPDKHFCNKTGKPCELATDYGYCKVTACTKRDNTKIESPKEEDNG